MSTSAVCERTFRSWQGLMFDAEDENWQAEVVDSQSSHVTKLVQLKVDPRCQLSDVLQRTGAELNCRRP